jgi:hypothetical protein
MYLMFLGLAIELDTSLMAPDCSYLRDNGFRLEFCCVVENTPAYSIDLAQSAY